MLHYVGSVFASGRKKKTRKVLDYFNPCHEADCFTLYCCHSIVRVQCFCPEGKYQNSVTNTNKLNPGMKPVQHHPAPK